jgi:hypothetical protein
MVQSLFNTRVFWCPCLDSHPTIGHSKYRCPFKTVNQTKHIYLKKTRQVPKHICCESSRHTLSCAGCSIDAKKIGVPKLSIAIVWDKDV